MHDCPVVKATAPGTPARLAYPRPPSFLHRVNYFTAAAFRWKSGGFGMSTPFFSMKKEVGADTETGDGTEC
tara:strand:+ start:1601 stop:1813 length:213 start_codon:yes stop_codon:yes gene_type:complete